MGKVKDLVQKSCAGTSPQALVPKVISKYLIGLSYQLITPAKMVAVEVPNGLVIKSKRIIYTSNFQKQCSTL